MSDPAPAWDDDTTDVVGAVHAVRTDDTEGLAAILSGGSLGGMLLAAVKLLAEACDEMDVTPGHWRKWAAHAATRTG